MIAITTSVELGHATAMTPATSEAAPYATIHPQALPSRASIAVISSPRVVSMVSSWSPLMASVGTHCSDQATGWLQSYDWFQADDREQRGTLRRTAIALPV